MTAKKRQLNMATFVLTMIFFIIGYNALYGGLGLYGLRHYHGTGDMGKAAAIELALKYPAGNLSVLGNDNEVTIVYDFETKDALAHLDYTLPNDGGAIGLFIMAGVFFIAIVVTWWLFGPIYCYLEEGTRR